MHIIKSFSEAEIPCKTEIDTERGVLNIFAVMKQKKINMYLALFLAWSRVTVGKSFMLHGIHLPPIKMDKYLTI